MKKILTCILLSLFWSLLLVAQDDATQLFSNGNAAYNGGNYALAIEKYEAILEQNLHSPAVYFNLANAHYRLGNVAQSVYYFEQAKRLAPEDQAIENNSRFAQNMTRDAIEELPTTQLAQFQERLLGIFSLESWSIITLCMLWLAIILLVLYRLNSLMLYKRIFFSSAILILLCSLTALFYTQQKYEQLQVVKGVVYVEEIAVWGEPNQRADELFLLHEGTTVEVIDDLNNWLKIKIANGSEGWIQKESLRLLD